MIQQRFLDSIGICAETDLIEQNLCLLSARRDISMLGLIHRTVLGKGPQQFQKLFRPGAAAAFARNTRSRELRHSLQLHDRMDGSQTNAIKRSVLSLVYPYNLLPPSVVALKTVSRFQRALQSAVKKACKCSSTTEWESTLNLGVRRMTVSQFQALFS